MHIEQTIITLYDEDELSIEQIAEQTGFDPLSVKALLMQKSTRYKLQLAGANGQGTLSGDVSDHEYKQFLQMYKNMAFDADLEPSVRSRIIRDLMDEYKGRKDVVHSNKPELTLVHINMALENVALARARTLNLKPAVVLEEKQLTEKVQ